MTEDAKKIAILENEIDRLEQKLHLANELNLKLFEEYKKSSTELQMLEKILERMN